MNIVFYVLFFLIICAYMAINLITAKMLTAANMKKKYIDGQCIVGMIFANLFYAPAWFLKGLRFAVVSVVK